MQYNSMQCIELHESNLLYPTLHYIKLNRTILHHYTTLHHARIRQITHCVESHYNVVRYTV
jgi:hypothetical protein